MFRRKLSLSQGTLWSSFKDQTLIERRHVVLENHVMQPALNLWAVGTRAPKSLEKVKLSSHCVPFWDFFTKLKHHWLCERWLVCVIHSDILACLYNYVLVTAGNLQRVTYIARSDSCDAVSLADVQLSCDPIHPQEFRTSPHVTRSMKSVLWSSEPTLRVAYQN